MSKASLIIGQSGTGKSTSIRNLNPETTFIINVLSKPLPFKNAGKFYQKPSEDWLTGNYYATDKAGSIVKILKLIDTKRTDIKTVVIDDFNYVMTNEFMNKSMEKGYDKFSEMAKDVWSILRECAFVRDDLYIFILSHSDTDSDGKVKCKTIGRMLDDKVCLEGMVTMVFHSLVVDGNYKFLTQNNGQYLAKTPMGMFENKLIDNDLLLIQSEIEKYYNEDIKV